MKSQTVRLTLDLSEFDFYIANLTKASPEIRKRFVRLFHGGRKAFVINHDGCAASANHMPMRLQPTQFFLGFMAALATSDRHIGILEHGNVLSDRMIAKSGGRANGLRSTKLPI